MCIRDRGIPAKDVLEQGLLSGMSVVGEKFKNNEVFVPEVLIAARAMNAGVAILKPVSYTHLSRPRPICRSTAPSRCRWKPWPG